jgi:hypothetical protein
MQAARDAEANALRQRLAKVERALEDATAEATSATAENAELRLRLERSRAGEAAGFLKDVVFKYLVADETAKPTIFLLLASVLQFSKGEIAHIKRMQEDRASTTEYRRENPEVRLISSANNLENQVSKLNKTKKELLAKEQTDSVKAQIKRIDEQKARIMKNFNDRVKAAQQ